MEVKKNVKAQILQYLKDIKETAGNMENTEKKAVRGMQLESIEFRIEKIKDKLELLDDSKQE